MPCKDKAIVEKVNQAMSLIRRRIMMKHPFFAMPSMSLGVVVLDAKECVETPHSYPITTMATDGRKLYVNPIGFLAEPSPYQIFTVMHEIMHCILLHVVRRGNRDRKLWNIATDLVVNYVLSATAQAIIDAPDQRGAKGRGNPGYAIPPDILLEEEIDGRPIAGMSAEQVYEILSRKYTKEEQEKLRITLRNDRPNRTKKDGQQKQPDPRMNIGRPGPGQPGGSCPNIEPSDLIKEDEVLGKSEQLTQEAMENIAAIWRDIGASALKAAQSRGSVPAGIVQLIELAVEPIISWKRKLAKFMTSHSRTGTDWNRPSRRWLYLGMYMPSRRRPSMGRILVVVDTSGSVEDDDLQQFLAETNAIAKAHDCVLELACTDTVMTFTGTYGPSKPLPKKVPITGRGGTAFIQPFQWAESECAKSQDRKIRLIVYLTDGYGTYPNWKVKIPTMWVLNGCMDKSHAYYPPFGEVASLTD